MNPSFIGDSYDLVKRFFCFELRALGYKVVVDPMFTGEWKGRECDFFSLLVSLWMPLLRCLQPAQRYS